MGTGEFDAGGAGRFMLQKPEISAGLMYRLARIRTYTLERS